MKEDIAGEHRGDGWVRLRCDAPGCPATVEGRPRLGEAIDGWVEDTRQTPRTSNSIRHYCPEHAAFAAV